LVVEEVTMPTRRWQYTHIQHRAFPILSYTFLSLIYIYTYVYIYIYIHIYIYIYITDVYTHLVEVTEVVVEEVTVITQRWHVVRHHSEDALIHALGSGVIFSEPHEQVPIMLFFFKKKIAAASLYVSVTCDCQKLSKET
jgi:hypothetical protein